MEAVFHTCFTFLMFLTFLTSTAPGPLPDTWAPLRRRLAPVPSNEDWARLKNEEGLLNDSLLDCSGGEMEDGRRWQGARNYWCDEILLELFDPSSVPFVHPKHELLVPSRLRRVAAAERIAEKRTSTWIGWWCSQAVQAEHGGAFSGPHVAWRATRD